MDIAVLFIFKLVNYLVLLFIFKQKLIIIYLYIYFTINFFNKYF